MTEDQIKFALGPELLELGPIEAGFHLVLQRMRELSSAGLLDEETLTAGLFGGLAVALPLAAKLYGSGIEEKARRCSWGPYNKAGRVSNKDSEAASGADFTLVLWESETHARVAVFQAKKGERRAKSASGWSIDVHRAPRKSSTRRPQLVMLAATGLRLTSKRDEEGNALDREAAVRILDGAKQKGRMECLSKFGWIHYLAYSDSVPVCISLSDLTTEVIEQEFAEAAAGSNQVEVCADWPSFYSLIEAGLGEEPGEAWLRLDKSTLELVLPDLLDFMPVYVADGRGGGVENVPTDVVDATVKDIAKPSSKEKRAALREVFATEAPEASSTLKM